MMEDLVDEQVFTPSAEPGWSAWNTWSPEYEFCRFAASLASVNHPKLVLETGVGQGYTTRYVAPIVGSYGGNYFGFESNDDIRNKLNEVYPNWMSSDSTPGIDYLRDADFTILDSDWDPPGFLRWTELSQWKQVAKPGAILLFHDATIIPGTPHHPRAEFIHREFGGQGIFLANPRGGFLYQKPYEL